ncbi:MAG: hypothetical protein JW843_12150 [Candidatus Aminicenantes bacterium]|nr:hypothetical protein [Candidatus Aminicenantes bacterium]
MRTEGGRFRERLLSWKILPFLFLAASVGIYFSHYLIFKDPHHIFIYLLGDLGFLFIDVLVVVLFIENLLEQRERKTRLRKLNMVVGTFFSEVGLELLRKFSAFVENSDELKTRAAFGFKWTRREFEKSRKAAADFTYRVEMDPVQLEELRTHLLSKRSFLLTLLENPNILDHESFTNLLWAVFHLAEELSFREGDLADLPKSDLAHISVDMVRAYSQIVVQWLAYAEHLKDSYPFLYSLAVRINPLGAHPSAVVLAAPEE